MSTREQELVEQIKQASIDYYTNGNSDLSDREFDALIEELENINPNAEILKQRELHDDDWNYQLETLPSKLYSIKKVKTWKEIQNWIDFVCKKIGVHENDKGNIELILTPKYDGIKLLHNNGKFYTRYETGEQGYNVTNRIAKSISVFEGENIGTEGELIISKSNFKQYCSGYTSSRNFIPAIFSSKEMLAAQDKVEYIRYSMYGDFDRLDKEEQLLHCNSLNRIKVPYLKVYYKDLTEDMIIKFYFDNQSDFEYDGVVIDINQEILRSELGETQKYLDCCRAYKGDALFDDIKESKIEEIVWQMSKYGKLTPVAKITPIVINEGKVSNVSLYNAAYIVDNKVFVGQRIKVTRKGKINPKIVEFIDEGKIGENVLIPAICPYCGNVLKWNESDIDLICENDNCNEQKAQKYYYFLKTIGIQNFGLESVRAFVNKGFELKDFFNRYKIIDTQVEGIGVISKQAFFDEIDRVTSKGIYLEWLQEASGCFPGLGSSTLKVLNTLNVDLEFLYNDRYYNEKIKEGQALDGIGKLSVETYFEGLYKFYRFYYESNLRNIIPIKEEEKRKSNKFEGCNVVFTGFRNSEWEEIINTQGGKVLSSVTSVCNLIVTKDKESNSSKLQKAKNLGIKILSIEEFQTLIDVTVK